MNGRYDKGREKFLRAEIDWLTDTFKAVLVSASYTPNLATHEFLSDISAGARVATSDAIGNKTVTAGWAGTDQVVWQAVSGAPCAAIVVIKDTGLVGTSPLLAYIDTGITNIPLGPTGEKVTFIIHPGTGLFRL